MLAPGPPALNWSLRRMQQGSNHRTSSSIPSLPQLPSLLPRRAGWCSSISFPRHCGHVLELQDPRAESQNTPVLVTFDTNPILYYWMSHLSLQNFHFLPVNEIISTWPTAQDDDEQLSHFFKFLHPLLPEHLFFSVPVHSTSSLILFSSAASH